MLTSINIKKSTAKVILQVAGVLLALALVGMILFFLASSLLGLFGGALKIFFIIFVVALVFNIFVLFFRSSV